MNNRNYSPIDRVLVGIDQTLRTLFGRPAVTERLNPGKTQQERLHIGRLMRVNHTGEVCAQALYQGQALTARDDARCASRWSARRRRRTTTWPGASSAG
jgi:ubiquinone biosynthesis monooxygenase Coq7